MAVFVCQNCWTVHTEDWFNYEWRAIYHRNTGTYTFEKVKPRENKTQSVECRICRKAVYKNSVDTVVEGTFETLEDAYKTISEDEGGQLYFLGYDVTQQNMPLCAVPIDRKTANAIAKKVRDGYVIIKIVAGKDKLLVFGISKERKSDEITQRVMRAGFKKTPRQEVSAEERTGILAFT